MADWKPPQDANGGIDWNRMGEALPPRDPSLGFHASQQEKREEQERLAIIMENHLRGQEAALETARLKAGVPIPPPMAPQDSIQMEFAMDSDTRTVDLDYLVDPFLPVRCVVGVYGRGSTAKSSFVGTFAADISGDSSTLWVSVEELTDWIKARHIKSGGDAGTLAVVTAVVSDKDSQGRAVGSSFDVYKHLEPAILKAKSNCEQMYHPPRPLKLVVLDTAVGLTGWLKGESPNDDASVKRLFAYLHSLAEKHDLTVVVIGHANKGKHEHFADTVMGATAWTNSPRLSFVHAVDRRDEYAYVLRVAKTNLVWFGATYSTEPVHTLYEREDGPDSVLVRTRLGPIVWGEADSLEMFEEATKKPKDEDGDSGEGGQKKTLVGFAVEMLVEMVHTVAEPVTRELVHQWLGREVSRREWRKIDERLRLAEFQYRVVIETGPQNKLIYRRAT
jgi:hypothetical protein